MRELSRRQVLAAGAVTVSLPMLDAALRTMRSAGANATMNPAGGARGGGGGRGGRNQAPPEKAGWFETTLKPADLKDNEFAVIAGHSIVLSRSGKTVLALSNRCTHQGCAVPPKAGAKILTCPCHQAQFNLDGTVAKAPARAPLGHYAVRVNDKGLIEIDPGQKPAPADKDGSLTLAADASAATAPATAPAH